MEADQKLTMLSEQTPHLHGGMNQQCPLKLDRHTQGSLIFSILVLVVVLIEERRYFLLASMKNLLQQ